MEPFSVGSAVNCESPRQLLTVAPSAEGLSVRFVFCATWTPSRYIVPVLPLRTTATCFHVFVGTVKVWEICCSPAPPDVVMPKRRTFDAPARGVRNMYEFVLAPMSKI